MLKLLLYIYIVYIVYRYIHSILYIYIHTYIFLYVYIRIYLPRTLDLSQEACCIMLHLCPGALGIGPPRIQRSRSFAILSIHCQRHVPTSASRCTKSRENINHVGRSNDTKDFLDVPWQSPRSKPKCCRVVYAKGIQTQCRSKMC